MHKLFCIFYPNIIYFHYFSYSIFTLPSNKSLLNFSFIINHYALINYIPVFHRSTRKELYLQMYDSYWDKEMKQSRTKNVIAFGYVEDLVSNKMPDPVAYYKAFVKQKNEERASAFVEETRPHTFASPLEYHLGHFLLHTLLERKPLLSWRLKCTSGSISTI